MKQTWKGISPNPWLSPYPLMGFAFLILYWLFGYDGITFSDDVYYLLAGKNFWEGTMQVNEYHFSSRWGAYIPNGLITYLLGFEPHIASLVSLISYMLSLGLLIRFFPAKQNKAILTLWFCTPIYFLHFLTKVYPDSLLVLFCTLVPIAASLRNKYPIRAGILLILALFLGFLTKETIIFLLPLPIVIFLFDWKRGNINPAFYLSLFLSGIFLGSAYLGYFWWEFGDPFFRVNSINAGHYISEFTYADKGPWAMIRRLTYLPILNFVERAYWPWLVFAIPGLALGIKQAKNFNFEFSLALLFLILGFWFMSSSLELYNPIYLNPRHLIILIPILATLIALGWNQWMQSLKWKKVLTALVLLGALISLGMGDFKMAIFQGAFLLIILISKLQIQIALTSLILLAPALYSISYQQNLKQYTNIIDTLNKESLTTDNKELIITNNFLDFSKEVLLPENPKAQSYIFPMEKIEELKPEEHPKVKVLIYEYYLHAYPKEGEDVEKLEVWLVENYRLISEENSGNVWIREFEKTGLELGD